MQSKLKILIVEDVPSDAELAQRELQRAGIACDTVRVETRKDFLLQIEELKPDLIISDFSLPQFDGKSALALAKEKCPDTPFIFVSGTIGEEVAVESLKNGATDYILKNNLKRLASAAARAVGQSRELIARRIAEQELKQTQERFKLFMKHLPGIALMKDLEGRITFVNQVMEQVAGRKAEELVGRTDDEIWPPEVARQMHEHDRTVIETRRMFQVIETIPQTDGEHSWLVSRFPVHDGSANLMLIGVTGVDLTDRLRAEQKVARLSRIRAFLSGIDSLIVHMRGRDELLQEACRIAVDHGGFKLAWIGLLDKATRDVGPLVWAGGSDDFIAGILTSARSDALEGKDVIGTVVKTGKSFVINDISAFPGLHRARESIEHGLLAVIGLPLQVEGETIGALMLYAGEVGVFDQQEVTLLTELVADISFALEFLEKKERLDYFAYYDQLTALPNRMLFCDRVNHFARSRVDETMAVLTLNLERFANVNYTLGRQASNALLKMFAERMQEAVGSAGEFARISGDVFAVNLTEVKDAADIAHILEAQIFSTMGRPFAVEGHELRLSFKCGIALFPNDGADAETLIRNADAALKNAKQSGDRYLFYAPQMNERIAEILSLENKLRIAIADEQFVLHYQPKLDLHTDQITGLEALIRWQSPELGLVPPVKFIPILEETGMIREVGAWVLRRAMLDYQQWLAKGLRPPRIAVNISALQLRQEEFAGLIEEAFRQRNDGLFHFDLEITESVIMDDIARNTPRLQAIKELGIGIAVDDFGTGYSSLSYLAKLPVTALKIDRSFIEDMVTNPDSMAIVSAVISLAHSLKLKVIAEGVETDEQSYMLMLLKCDEIQGYLFSRPQPPEEIEAFFAGRESPR